MFGRWENCKSQKKEKKRTNSANIKVKVGPNCPLPHVAYQGWEWHLEKWGPYEHSLTFWEVEVAPCNVTNINITCSFTALDIELLNYRCLIWNWSPFIFDCQYQRTNTHFVVEVILLYGCFSTKKHIIVRKWLTYVTVPHRWFHPL